MSDDVLDPMTDTITPREAAAAVAHASRFEDTLRVRTHGLTWMIWGLVTPAIFMTYAFSSVLAGPGWWFAVLWLPWTLGGLLATIALWRSAALATPALGEGARGNLWRSAALIAVFTGAFAIFQPVSPIEPLIITGAVWATMGIVDLFPTNTQVRFLTILAGALLAGIGGVLLVTQPTIEMAGLVAFLSAGSIPLLGGLYLTLRG